MIHKPENMKKGDKFHQLHQISQFESIAEDVFVIRRDRFRFVLYECTAMGPTIWNVHLMSESEVLDAIDFSLNRYI